MKHIFLLSVGFLLLQFSGVAQDQYTDGMNKAFELWEENKTGEAVALFERIGQAKTDAWHPMYYAANVLISESFSKTDPVELSTMLEKAKTFIAAAHERSPDNSEILTLEGLLYTSFVAMDAGTYGMIYSGKIMELHSRAIKLNPDNPRALANKIEYEMGSARFFKQDMMPFCDRLKEVIPKFDSQESDDPFAPKYGKERVENVIENCGN